MQQRKKYGTARALVVFACIAAVLLVAGLQAAHIHRDWLNPDHHGFSANLTAGTDEHCVLCVGSFAATLAPHVDAVESLVAHTERPPVAAAILYDHRAASDFTIRPPPSL